MQYLNKPVAYLQDFDFDSNGNLINKSIPNNKPVIIMIQAKFCGHCTVAKPAFQEFAEKNKDKVFCATIEGDGNQKGESELAQNIKKIYPNFRGYPSYVVYKNNKFSKVHDGGRDLKSLTELLNSL
jgi:thiol-disulfide isomerase/thioredoxin